MVTRKLVAILVVALFLSSLSFAVSDDEKAQAVLTKAADALGWPDTVTSNTDNNEGTGRSYTITDTGDSSGEVSATVAVFGTEQEPQFWMSFMDQELDVVHSSYQGRDAEIGTFGENCNPKPLVKMLNDMFNGFFSDIFGPSDQTDNGCVTDTGSITWVCGDYIFTASDSSTDPDNVGGEKDAAAALYTAATNAGLCEYGDTLVLMAEPSDISGTKPLSDIGQMTQNVNAYYAVNAMGQRPPFKFSFLDAGNKYGDGAWFQTDTPASTYNVSHNGAEWDLGVDAIKKAFDGADVPDDLYFERIVVVYAGQSQQNDDGAAFSNCCMYRGDSNYVEVDASQGKRKIYFKNMIALSEFRNLGGWVHEFGHSLTSKYPNPSGGYRITDRYNYAKAVSPQKQYGTCNMWDVMGSGSHWGADDGGTPVQMSSFTKFAAGWLGYGYASEGNSYTITALEDMKQGDSALRIDNPESSDPDDYMIIEARDGGAPYGAPASGVELYDVYWDYSYNHHVVNALETQSGPTEVNSADGDYSTPTMYATDPSNGSTYTDPDWEMKLTVTATTANPYTATVKIENYTPANLVGVQMHPGPVPVTGPVNPGTTTENALDGTMPDMDLHAYDDQSDHVGMNYQTGQYEDNIPGAIASGNLVGGTEWIYVPAGTHVRYEISTYRTEQFLAANPQLAANATPQNYSATAVKFDSQGVRYVADLGSGSADAGAKVSVKDPAGPSLNYQQKPLLGVGKNSNQLCPLLPAFFIFLLSSFLWKKRSGAKK